jgi:hypothetical protein
MRQDFPVKIGWRFLLGACASTIVKTDLDAKFVQHLKHAAEFGCGFTRFDFYDPSPGGTNLFSELCLAEATREAGPADQNSDFKSGPQLSEHTESLLSRLSPIEHINECRL